MDHADISSPDRALSTSARPARSAKPRFRVPPPTVNTSQAPDVAGFTLPGLSTSLTRSDSLDISQDPGYISLRRSTRSLASGSTNTTPVKAELIEIGPNQPAPSSATSTPSKRPKLEHPSPTATPSRSTRRTIVKAELREDDLVEIGDVKLSIPASPEIKRKPSTPRKAMPLAPLTKAHPTPARWEEQYKLIEEMRRGLLAPVDTMGCERPDLGPVPDISNSTSPSTPASALATPHAPPLSPSIERTLPAKTRRFHVLISLMLSSQTKDAVTSAAVTSLHHTLPGGLTSTSLAAAEREVVEGCINKVGFWRRKAGYIQETAQRLEVEDLDKAVAVDGDEGDSARREGDGVQWEPGEIPRTIEGLCALKGVGPKMAYLALQCAWDINAGIGVDVHVHRITNRLKWHKPHTTTPEQTRVNLESWLPSELHKGINPMLVGFGQMVCLPIGPRCDICLLGIRRICPSRVAGVKAEGRKVVAYTYTLPDGAPAPVIGPIVDLEDSVGCLPMPMAETLVKMEVKEENGDI